MSGRRSSEADIMSAFNCSSLLTPQEFPTTGMLYPRMDPQPGSRKHAPTKEQLVMKCRLNNQFGSVTCRRDTQHGKRDTCVQSIEPQS